MNSLSKIFTAIFCLAFFVLIPNTVKAQTESIDKILNPDGTIKPGHDGSYNVAGYTLVSGTNGQPVLAKSDSLNESGNVNSKRHFGKSINGTWALIRAIAISGTDVYFGGSFTMVEDTLQANYIVKWDGIKWTALSDGLSNGVNDDVKAIAVFGSEIYIGGDFTRLSDGTIASRIAKWNTITNTWSTLQCGEYNGLNYSVNALAIIGTELYVGGWFQNLSDGTSVNNIAKWNLIANSWSSLQSGNSNGVNGSVSAFAVIGNDLYIGGSFSQLGDGTSVNKIVKYNTVANTWSILPSGASNGVTGSVVALAVKGAELYVGGWFESLGDGTLANYIAKWDISTNTWSTLPCGIYNGVNFYVYSLAVIGEELFVGGTFWELANRTLARGIAKWNTSSNTWSILPSGASNGVTGQVNTLAVIGTELYVGGGFDRLGNGKTLASNIAKWNTSSNTWSVFPVGGHSGVYGTVKSLAINGTDIYVGGSFDELGDGSSANNIAKYSTSKRIWSALPTGSSNGVNGNVRALSLIGADLYVGGEFVQLGDSTSANNIAKYNTVTKTWSTLPSGSSNGVINLNSNDYCFVSALASIGTDLYVGGQFTHVGDSTSANNIAKWNTVENAWSIIPSGSYNGVNRGVNVLAVKGGDLFVGGWFFQLGDGSSANFIAKYNTVTQIWANFVCGGSNGVGGRINAIAINGVDLFVGGSFSELGDGTPARNIAKFNMNTNIWTTLACGASDGVIFPDAPRYCTVNSLAIIGPDLIVGGEFTNLGDGTSANNIAKWNLLNSSWSILPCEVGNGVQYPNYSSAVNALMVNSSDLYIGGHFNCLGDFTGVNNLVRYNTLTNTWGFLLSSTDAGEHSSPQNEVIKTYALQQNYPNPFNPSTTISYDIASPAMVTMVLYDALGREVKTLVNEEKNAGKYTLTLNASTLASGVYFYQLRAGKFVQTKKLMLLK